MAVTAYPQVYGTTASTTYSVTAGGTTVFVEDIGEDRNFCHFEFTDSVEIVVTVSESVSSYALSPKRHNIISTPSGTTITFTLTTPRKLILHEVNALTEKLFIFADGPEVDPPEIGDGNVTDITAVKTIDLTGETDERADIQAAIDTITAAGGGVLYFPAGKYRVLDQLYIKNNVRVYLAAGARIYYPGGTYKYIYFGTYDPSPASNASIEGRGSVSGQMIKTNVGSSNITLKGIVVMPCLEGWWAVNANYCTNFVAQNVKVINFWELTSDGFDIDYSSNSLVEDCFYYGGDDAFAVHAKNEGAKTDISNVTFRNGVCYAGSRGCTIGSETYNASISNIIFENIDIISFSTKAVSVDEGDTATIDTVYFNNIRVEKWTDHSAPGETNKIIYIILWTRVAPPPGGISNITFRNLTSDISSPSRITGYNASYKVTNVTLDNVFLDGTLVTNTTNGQITTNDYISNLVFTTNFMSGNGISLGLSIAI